MLRRTKPISFVHRAMLIVRQTPTYYRRHFEVFQPRRQFKEGESKEDKSKEDKSKAGKAKT